MADEVLVDVADGIMTVTINRPKAKNAVNKAAAEVQKELVGKVYSQKELDMALKFRDEFRAKKGAKK